MTRDRRRHPRVTLAGDGREIPGDRRQRSREPADAHFRHLHDTRDRRAEPSGDTPTDDQGIPE